MGYLVTLTFDLHPGKPKFYYSLTKKLGEAGFLKTLYNKKKKRNTKLPSNIYVKLYKGKSNANSSSIRNAETLVVKSILKKLGRNAAVLIIVGNKWSWGNYIK